MYCPRFGKRDSFALAPRLLLWVGLAILGPLPPAVAQADPLVIQVNDNGGGLVEDDGTTLPEALAQAFRDPRDNEIRFDPRVFGAEPVTIKLDSPIEISSRDAGHDVIDGTSVLATIVLDLSAASDAGLTVGGEGRLTLRRVILRGGRQRTILLKESGRLTLDEVAVREAGGPGLALFGQSSATIIRSQLALNRTHGIELHGRSAANLDHVDLRQNGQSGLAGFDEALAFATDCRFDANGDWNIVLSQSAQAHLTRCLLREARFANVDLSGSAVSRFDDCTLEKGKRFGIFATGQSGVELTEGTLRDHGGRGIEAQDEVQVTLDKATVEGNEGYGVILFGRASIRATACTITGNGAHGASLRDQATGAFEGCSFTSNHYSGLGCLDDGSGGKVKATRCLFQQNGMRPVYRGPLHLDPLVPTPVRIDGSMVQCLAEPGAMIELYLDPAGEARHYLRTVKADKHGQFQVDCEDIPEGWTMTAAATSRGATSEFNVIAGTTPGPVLNALLGRTGPLSDTGGRTNLDTLVRRWKPGTHLIFRMDKPPSIAVDRYVRFLMKCIPEWTGSQIDAEMRIGRLSHVAPGSAVIPVRYVPSDSKELLGRGGVTFMKWDAAGYFMPPMEIVVALGKDTKETCPRVLAHEVGHTLGLCHARVGLLSRMQGATPPGPEFVNDFSPIMTFYDVLALQILHDPQNKTGTTLRQLVDRGAIPHERGPVVVGMSDPTAQPSFSPPADDATDTSPDRSER